MTLTSMPNTQPKSNNKPLVKQPDFTRAVGRRKTAVARVRLYPGKGDNLVNDLSVSEYFPGVLNESIFLAPFRATNVVGKFYVTVKVAGGGPHAQVEAVSLGIARALVIYDSAHKSTLRKKDLITRDPRMKERRKAGYAQKARARKQSPKR